jgi:hypothetical protein
MKNQLIIYVFNDELKCFLIHHDEEETLTISNLFTFDDLEELKKFFQENQNLDQNVLVLFESSGELTHTFNLPLLPKYRIKSIITNELKEMFGSISNYKINYEFLKTDKKYYQIVVTLLKKQRFETLNEIAKMFKMKLNVQLTRNILDIFTEKSKPCLLLKVMNNYVVASLKYKQSKYEILLEKFNENNFHIILNTLLLNSKISKEEFLDIEYYIIESESKASREKHTFIDSIDWNEISLFDYVKKSIEYSIKNKGVSL